MKLTVLFICFFCSILAFEAIGQNEMEMSIEEQIIDHQFSDLQLVQSPKRKFINLSNTTVFQKLNPVMYLGAGLLFFYQRVLSEQISADCTYQISCSESTKKAIEKHGFIKGALLGIHQLSSCVPGNIHEHAKHMISESGKIINDF